MEIPIKLQTFLYLSFGLLRPLAHWQFPIPSVFCVCVGGGLGYILYQLTFVHFVNWVSNCIYNNEEKLCSSIKKSIPTPWNFIGNSQGRGVLTANILETKHEAKLEFPRGRGCKTKNFLWGEYGYFLELHN